MKMGSVCESFELVPGGKRKNNKITEPFLSFEQQALEIATYQDLCAVFFLILRFKTNEKLNQCSKQH